MNRKYAGPRQAGQAHPPREPLTAGKDDQRFVCAGVGDGNHRDPGRERQPSVAAAAAETDPVSIAVRPPGVDIPAGHDDDVAATVGQSRTSDRRVAFERATAGEPRTGRRVRQDDFVGERMQHAVGAESVVPGRHESPGVRYQRSPGVVRDEQNGRRGQVLPTCDVQLEPSARTEYGAHEAVRPPDGGGVSVMNSFTPRWVLIVVPPPQECALDGHIRIQGTTVRRRRWTRGKRMSALIQMSTEVARRQLNLMGFKSRWLGTPQGRLHLLDAPGTGESPPIVLLHGLSASAVHFGPILGALRHCCERVLALDLPGHGLSERSDEPLTSARLWAGLRSALDAVDVGNFVLLGSSLGGFGAVRYAGARPERLNGLILCSPGGAPLKGVDLSEFKGRFVLRGHADGLGFVDRFLARRPVAPIRHALAWGVRQTMADPGIKNLVASVGYDDFLAPEELAELQPPTFLIWGQSEKLLPEASFRFYADHLPESAWIERPLGFGHTPYLEQPTAFMNRVKTFLIERVVSPPRPGARRRFGPPRKRPYLPG